MQNLVVSVQCSSGVGASYIINGTRCMCALETSGLFSQGYFEILFGLSESHHLLPTLAHSPTLLCCGRPALPRWLALVPGGNFPLARKEKGGKRAATTAFLHRFTRSPSELHFQLLNLLPTRVNLFRPTAGAALWQRCSSSEVVCAPPSLPR